MPKVLVKGGIWKNTEDEILKVAVMKYGKNQWSRIASLLHRKTAKQCKARWYEWLDPGIKKTEWTREEDEKLLHLAKLMPTQWRTIAPMVGRTANQCLERYEYLLDQAQVQESGLDPSEDPRKLRPGEVDPNPETRPARPDSIDMDEDELEMLSEARARLANTQGKKAKRKAREKQLEEARRLATLQKKRELRAAGVNLILLNKIKRCCDLNFEIPFEKKPTPGFYDTSHEQVDPDSEEYKDMRAKEYTRRDRSELLERKKDKDKYDKLRENDLLGALQKFSENTTIKRSKLILPNPQISELELSEVVKLGAEAEIARLHVSGLEDNFPTKSLLNDYAMTPVSRGEPPSERTPLAVNNLTREAQTIIALNYVETPLKGGVNTPLEDEMSITSKPNKMDVQTPNTVLASPYMTPSHGKSKEFTPLRDNLNINKDSQYSSATNTPVKSKNKVHIHSDLRHQLTSLPKPIDDFQIEMPEVTKNKLKKNRQRIADASDEINTSLGVMSLQERQKLSSQSLQRNLPIPKELKPDAVKKYFVRDPIDNCEESQSILFNEMVDLIDHDVRNDLDYTLIDPKQLEHAKSLIQSEMKPISLSSTEEFNSTWDKYHDNKKLTQLDINTYKRFFSRNRKHINKLKNKLGILNNGYANRKSKLSKEYIENLNKIASQNLEVLAFQALKMEEEVTAPSRLAKMRDEIRFFKKMESDLQKYYSDI